MHKITALLILSCVFFPLALAAMSLISVRPWVLDRGFYERIVSDERLYEALSTGKLPGEFYRSLFAEADQLPEDALAAAIREVVTPDYLRTQALNTVNQVFAFIDGQSAAFEIGFDSLPLKAALMGDGGERFAQVLAQALPTCEVDQQAIFLASGLPSCIAVDSSVSAAREQIIRALPAVLATMPERIALNRQVNFGNDWGFGNWFGAIPQRWVLDIGIVILVITTLATGLFAAYLGGDDLRGRVAWLGLSLLVPASLFVLMGLIIGTPLIDAALRIGLKSANWYGFQYSEAFGQAVRDVISPLVQQIGSGFLLTGIVSCLISFGLLVWSWRISPADAPSERVVRIPARNVQAADGS